MRIDNYDRNTQGRDMFVGDIHGEYGKLLDALCKVKFDETRDTLWAVGDIVDRGPDSLKCLSLIKEPWFNTVKGNHEQMMIDATITAFGNASEKYSATNFWAKYGGQWYYDLTEEFRSYADSLIPLAEALPNGIRVGDIGIVHAECPLPDWDLLAIDQGSFIRETAMWSCNRESYGIQTLVAGVDAVVVGHTPAKDTKVLGNHVYIDSGVCFYPDRGLTVLSYDEIIALVNSKGE